MKILVIEDDDSVIRQLAPALKSSGFALEISRDGIDGEFLGNEEQFDAIVLDLGLPGRNGMDVLRHWRARGNRTPVIILTGRDAWHERVDGLKCGADDYLCKPFHAEELLARLEAVLRRHHGHAENCIRTDNITLNFDTQELTTGKAAPQRLTAIEFRMLRYFMMNPGKLISKRELSEHIYEDESLRDSNVIEVYVNRLRQRINCDAIETRRGQGYIFKKQ